MRARVVDELGMRTAGFVKSCTTQSSATFGKQAVSEIVLRSFFKYSTFFFLGSGDTSTYFQMVGGRYSRKDALIILRTG